MFQSQLRRQFPLIEFLYADTDVVESTGKLAGVFVVRDNDRFMRGVLEVVVGSDVFVEG